MSCAVATEEEDEEVAEKEEGRCNCWPRQVQRVVVRLRGPGTNCFVGHEVQNIGAPLARPVVHDSVPRRAPSRDLIMQAATATDCLDTVELLVCFFRLRPLRRCCVSF